MESAFCCGIFVIQFFRSEGTTFKLTDCLKHEFLSHLTYFTVVNLHFRQSTAQLEVFSRPNVSRVHLLSSLHKGYSPLPLFVEYRPVDGRRPAISFDTGVHNQALVFGVDVSWDWLHESGTDDQVRLECLDSLAHGRLARSYLEEGLVALVDKSFIDLLGEAIVS